MRRVARFLLVLFVGAALLAGMATFIVEKTIRKWFEEDLALRSLLVAKSTENSLLVYWTHRESAQLSRILVDIARDKRIMAVAACTVGLELLSTTPQFPSSITCKDIAKRSGESGLELSPVWSSVWKLADGDVHVSAVPINAGERPLGNIVLVHDLAFIDRRESHTRNLLLLAFSILALGASLVTIIAARLSWRGFRKELLRFIKGESQRKEFLPIVRDVRELVERIAAEREQEGLNGIWNPQRLKQTLVRFFPGEKVIVLANREPYIHERMKDGSIKVRHPASGLVTAVEPVLRACSGVWVAHGSGSADKETVDSHHRVRVPPEDPSYSLRRVWLTPEEERGYYYGLANEGLWPLCHLAHTRPIFRGSDYTAYETVNRKFAEATQAEADTDDPIVLVQDYHFALAPRLIRERLRRATIITFWHIPWPNAERLGICPWRADILEGLLGSSILGFHTQLHCNNFLDSVDRYLEARIDREQSAVVIRGQTTLVRPYPISISWPNEWANHAPPIEQCRLTVRQSLGLPNDAFLGVGVDRLDYTKGIEERLLTVERFLERFPNYLGRFAFVQLAAPSRTLIDHYRELDETIERTVKRINGRFAKDGYEPIRLLRAHHEPPDVFRFYRASDFCYVSSLHDGMNLVAKEFVAARDDEAGVLILSQFTGAARELSEALMVNPYDMEQTSTALNLALTMPREEQRERMHAMRAYLTEFNVYRWAGRMLVDAARLRKRASTLQRIRGDFARFTGFSE